MYAIDNRMVQEPSLRLLEASERPVTHYDLDPANLPAYKYEVSNVTCQRALMKFEDDYEIF